MAEKETKSKATETKTAATKSTAAKSVAKSSATEAPKQAKATAAAKETKTTPKTTASATEAKAVKPETKSAAAKPAEKSTTKVDKQAVASVVAKHSNPSGRKPLVPEPEMKTAPKSKDAHVAEVVEQHATSRGKLASVFDFIKGNKNKAKAEQKAARSAAAAETAVDRQKRNQTILLWILIGLLLASLLAGGILGIVKAVSNPSALFVNQYASAQAVGYYGEILGTVKRNKPVEGLHDGGLPAYPKYGSTLKSVIGGDEDKAAARGALVVESSYLCAWGTRGANRGGEQTDDKYTIIDKDGYLYQIRNGERVHSLVSDGVPYVESNYRRLYAHTASVGMYLGNVSDNEPGVIKKLTLRNRGYTSYSITGLYAPAGEVIKVQISGKDMNATGGLVFYIGQALYNGQANNIWVGKNQMQRMPHVLNTLAISKDTAEYDEATDTYTGYIGSFLGGPIYIANESATFDVTISGAVTYQHFILGYTTPEEFAQNAKSSAPYFDLEVWSYGVLLSGPRTYANAFSYDDLYKAAILWEKVAMVSTTNGSKQGIVFIFDPFVAAGAAVAFPGRSSVNCPLGWMKQALNYNGLVSGGSWGNFHEYHHNFQNYGLGSGADGEVTNNGLNLVSYSLFTKISSKRQIAGYGGAGLGGWNSYTSATWTLNRVNTNQLSSTNGLAVYATLLHNLGQDQYIKARGASGATRYFDKWANNTHLDFTYYAQLTNSYYNGGSNAYNPSQAVKDANYPLFVPVASVYQTGRTYMYDNEKREINTMQPYVINYGDPFTVDLNPYKVNSAGQYESGSVVIGKGFTYKIKSVDASKANGTFTETDTAGVYTFKPNSELLSGKIYVTLEITTEDGAHEWNGHALQDVDLILEFEQTHAKTKNTLERTTYTYDAGKMYTDAEAAFNANFAGYTSSVTENHSNPTQNCNTDVWFYPDTAANREKYPNIPESYFAHENTVVVIEGKLYFEETGKYRVYLRGRKNCAVYYSLDESANRKYALGATIKDTAIPKNSAYFRPDDENTYFDITIDKENSWMYFKEVLIVENAKASGTSFIGLGVKEWQEPMFTMQEKYYDKNGKEVAADSPDIVRTETKYFNYLGIEVSESVANNTDLIAPQINSGNQPYVNAYRTSYKNETAVFDPDYFYGRTYTYNYADNKQVNTEQKLISTNYAKGNSWSYGSYPIENLTDGNRSTFIHTKNGVGGSATKPLTFVMDLGEVKTVNRLMMYTQNRPNGDWHCPKDFVLEGSIDGNEFTLIGEFQNVPRSGLAITVDFEETQMRYYRLNIIGSRASLIILGEIEMWHTFEATGAQWMSPHGEQFNYYGNWKLEQTQATFGQVYVGGKNATMKFEFEGSRLGILSSTNFGANFEVTIDGKVVTSVSQLKPLSEQSGYTGLSFLSDILGEGKHEVVIKCKGEATIDSIAIYPNPPKPAA